MRTNSLTPQAPLRGVVNLGWVHVLLSMETALGFAASASDSVSEPAVSGPAAGASEGVIPAARRVLIQQIIAKHASDRSWGKPLDERAPLGGAVEDIAILCRLALLQTGDKMPSVAACLEKAANWLAANRDKTSCQGRNLELLMRRAKVDRQGS